MEVTTENFSEILKEFDNVIDKASFFAIDTEFTGLYTERTSPYDNPAEVYKKMSAATEDFIIVQFGLTAFWPEEGNAENFTYKSYNFYVYPQAKDQLFKCSGSSMSFLSEHKFDFNKLFQSGISCCDKSTALQLRQQLEEKQKYRATFLGADGPTSQVPVPVEEVDNLQEIRTNIKTFLSTPEKENIIIGSTNAFQRKLIYQMIENEFSNKITATSQQIDNMKKLVIERKISAERQVELTDQQNQKDEDEYNRCIGLSALLHRISDSKKLIVGHNMLLDLLYIIRQFFEPIPSSLQAFKKRAHKIFPNILDTKHLCSERFKAEITSSVLNHVYEAVLMDPFALPVTRAASEEYAYTSQKDHEAGYDSYVTGLCFLGLVKQLNIANPEINEKSPALRNFLNKIFLMRLSDIHFVNLTGPEPTPSRDHVFHVTFPESWKQSDIVHHFRNYGSVWTSWIDNVSAYIALNNRENAPILLKSIGQSPGVKISTFASFKKLQQSDADKKAEGDQKTAQKRRSDETNDRPVEEKRNKAQSSVVEKVFTENDDWE